MRFNIDISYGTKNRDFNVRHAVFLEECLKYLKVETIVSCGRHIAAATESETNGSSQDDGIDDNRSVDVLFKWMILSVKMLREHRNWDIIGWRVYYSRCDSVTECLCEETEYSRTVSAISSKYFRHCLTNVKRFVEQCLSVYSILRYWMSSQ